MGTVVLENLVKSFDGVPAVDGVSFEVPDGAMMSLLGASGCGKTTTLRCIAGLERNDSGTIRIGSSIVSDPAHRRFVPANRRKIGMVFQSYAIWPHMTVAENVGYPLRMAGIKGEARTERVTRALKLVELERLADRPATTLSGGQQQRVALARAVVGEPQLLLFDEPLSNLDAKLRDQTRFELRALQQNLRTTSIYVTHDQAEAMAISDLVAVMHEGKIRQIGTPIDLYQRPANSFVAKFIGAANLIPVRDANRTRGGDVEATTASGGTRLRIDNSRVTTDDPAAAKYLCLRPEDALLTPAAVKAPDELKPNRIRGTLARLVYLGERQECWVEAEGVELRLYASAYLPLSPGDQVDVEFEPNRCTLLAD